MNAFQEDWQIPNHWFDYYECLGISEKATEDEIKKAYRKLAKENHPDLYPGDKVKEEKFKNINIAYDILSDESKRKAYDYDYKKRKGNAQTNNTSQNTNSYTNTSSSNASQNTQDSSKSFDDIVSDYKKNPSDKRTLRNLKEALEIIVTSFEDYEKLVDEAYQDLFSGLFKKEISKEDYLNTSSELKQIIKEEIDKISDFLNVNSFLANISDLDKFFRRSDSVLSEYDRKTKILSKKYFVLVNFSKNFYDNELKRFIKNEYLFVRELKSRLDPIDKELDSLENDFLNDKIDKNLLENKLGELSVKFNEVREWLNLLFNISSKESNVDFLRDARNNILQHKLNDTASYIRDISYEIKARKLIVIADELISELRKYKIDNFSELYKNIKDNSITKKDYDDLKHKYDVFKSSIDVIYYSPEVLHSHSDLRNKSLIIEGLLENNYLVNHSWNDIINHITSYERRVNSIEAEKIANNLLKEVDSIMEFVRSLVDTSLTFKDLLTSSRYSKIDFYENRCREIKTEMENIKGYEREKDNINSAVYGLKLDLNNLFGVFGYFKKFVTKMASYEDYFYLCIMDTEKINSLFSDLQKFYSITGRSELTSEETLSFDSKIKEILSVFEENNNAYSELEGLTFQAIREGGKTFKIDGLKNNISYCFNTRRKPFTRGFNNFFYGLSFSCYNEFINLKNRVESWLENNNIDILKKRIVKDKIENMVKSFSEMLKNPNFVIDMHDLSKTNFDLVKKEKDELIKFLEEINQLLLTHADILTKEESEEYWKAYQGFKSQCDNLISSKVDVVKKFKMQTLELLKFSQASKNKIMASESISDEELSTYIESLFNYHMNVVNIKLIDSQDEIIFLEEKVKVYEMVLSEISMLRSKNSNTLELEDKYNSELEEIRRKLFFAQNDGKSESYLEYLWKQTKLEQSLSNSDVAEQVFLEYLEVVGNIAREEYLSEHSISEDEILNSIRNIEANMAYLVAKKNVLLSRSIAYDELLKEQTLNSISLELDECKEQLNILKL